MRFAKALPPILFAAAIMLGYFVLNQPDEAAPPQLAPVQAQVGQPPDTHWINERIIELPEDGGLWHTVLVVDDTARSQNVLRQFDTDPRLKSLTQQTKTYVYKPSDPWVRKNRPGQPVPSVLVMAPTAVGSNEYQRAYEQWGDALPPDSNKLANDIAVSIRDCRPRPTPTPTPNTPQPVQPVTPVIPVTPDEQQPDEQQPADDESLDWMFYAISAAAGLGGAYLGVKKELAG